MAKNTRANIDKAKLPNTTTNKIYKSVLHRRERATRTLPNKNEYGGNKFSPLRKTVCGIELPKGIVSNTQLMNAMSNMNRRVRTCGLIFSHPSKTYRNDEQQRRHVLENKEPWEESQQSDSGEPVHLKLQYERSNMKTTWKYVPCSLTCVSSSLSIFMIATKQSRTLPWTTGQNWAFASGNIGFRHHEQPERE